MRNRIVTGIICTLLLLSVLKPAIPVWAGAMLLAFVTLRAGRDLRSPYARERWAAFKRLAAMAVFGFTLLGFGICTDTSLPPLIASSADARHAVAVLGICFTALIGAPCFVLLHITRSQAAITRRLRVSRNVHTLSRIAAEGGRKMTRVAV